MKSQVGLWIDHRKAVIVIVTDEGEETRLIDSNMEKHVDLRVVRQRTARQRARETDNLRAISTRTMTRSLRPSAMRNPS